MKMRPNGENRGSAVASSPPLAGERVAFTGTLASMTHRQAHEIVEQHGGTATAHVSRQTSMLVVGEEGWSLEADGAPSQKLQQVTEWQREGLSIRVLAESDWLHLLGLEEQRRELHRLHTPAMLSQVLDVPVAIIRGWERSGLIVPVKKVYRLPYFDFQEVAGARRLAELLAAGVSREKLELALRQLCETTGAGDRPLAQLELLARDARVLLRDQVGLLEPATRQRVFDFEATDTDTDAASPMADDSEAHAIVALSILDPGREPLDDRARTRTADDWFREGCLLAADDEIPAAIEALRMCLMLRPADAETNLLLAECLYRQGHVRGALERYFAAVEADHDYLEAWTQLGCLHAELGEPEAALEAFRIALSLHAEFPDAHWHLADVLSQLGRSGEAVDHWRAYLQYDNRGPWAETARQRLEELEPERPISGGPFGGK